MRISSYEIILPLIDGNDSSVPDKTLLVNGLYGAFDVVDSATASLLQEGDLSGIPFSMAERLALRGHITRKDEEGELADALLLGRIYSQTIGRSGVGPVLMPTYDCNFRCPYCFEKHRLSKGQEWLSCAMSPEMVDAVFAALTKLRDKGHHIENCGLYGGEPLLKENIATVRNICEHARDMGLKITAITNGYDLDSYIGLMEEFGFSRLQITVDGVGELNDRRRIHRDGIPTYEKIMDNIALTLEHGIDIVLRVNVNSENLHGIGALLDDIRARGLKTHTWEDRIRNMERKEKGEEQSDHVKKKGFFSCYFKAVSEPLDSPTRITEQQIMDEILGTGMPSLDAILYQSQYSGFLDPVWTAMTKKGYPPFNTTFCGAESGALVIGPDGLIHTCWDLVAIEEEAVGMTDVESGRFLYNFNKPKWRLRTSDHIPACQKCPHIFICRGGCAAEAKREHDSYFRESCHEFRELFAFTASRIACRRYEETGEDELTLSLLGPVSRLTDKEREQIMTSTSAKDIMNIIREAGFVNTQ